jgi:hypothetical protein
MPMSIAMEYAILIPNVDLRFLFEQCPFWALQLQMQMQVASRK